LKAQENEADVDLASGFDIYDITVPFANAIRKSNHKILLMEEVQNRKATRLLLEI